MNRKNALLFLLSIYSIIGIVSLISAFHVGAATASLSFPEKRKAEPASKIETESAFSGLLNLNISEIEENVMKKEPVYAYTAIHHTGRLFIRNGPSLEDKIIGFMRPGTTGDVVSIGDEWVLLHYGEIEGYVFKGYLELTEVE